MDGLTVIITVTIVAVVYIIGKLIDKAQQQMRVKIICGAIKATVEGWTLSKHGTDSTDN